ncbi:hypothetical protein [Streptomyces minutiscleroticus]|uniref:Uncharacterized protein n=1 Tax=Streptomyces minutiscleroticus TaxID=68238 RepID=A0A918KLI0_9ACTN|nr:hypothetical protein [Streptomyces minutiscleroticus]GGX66155.1 hypothetical protein GCM10010358_20680 [Streptomyces minutiscleroticus]
MRLDDRLPERPKEQSGPGDPRFTRAPGSRRPHRPRKDRPGPAWPVLAAALALLTTGIALPSGLLTAAGLVMAGIAGHLFDPPLGKPSADSARTASRRLPVCTRSARSPRKGRRSRG